MPRLDLQLDAGGGSLEGGDDGDQVTGRGYHRARTVASGVSIDHSAHGFGTEGGGLDSQTKCNSGPYRRCTWFVNLGRRFRIDARNQGLLKQALNEATLVDRTGMIGA